MSALGRTELSRSGGVGVDRFVGGDPLSLLGASRPSTPPPSGVKALMLAVLEDGIRCYFSAVPRLRAEADHWIESGRRTAFSFVVICEILGLEPDAARAALRRLRVVDAKPSMLRKRHRATVRRASVSVPC